MPTTSLLTRYSTACPCAQFSEANQKATSTTKSSFPHCILSLSLFFAETKRARGIRHTNNTPIPISALLQHLATSDRASSLYSLVLHVATHCALSETRGHVLPRSTCQTGPMQPHSQAAYTLMPSSMPSDVAASPQLSRVVGKVHRFATPGPALPTTAFCVAALAAAAAHTIGYRAIQKSGLFQLTLMCEGYAKASSIFERAAWRCIQWTKGRNPIR